MMNFESIRLNLVADDATKRLQTAIDLRERVEIVHTSEFSNFLTTLFPAFKTMLIDKTKPQLIKNSENKFRNVLLEILNRLPNNDVLKPYAEQLLQLVTSILKVENEENALICLRIIFDLHKNYRPTLEPQVQQFLDQVQEFYKGLESTLTNVFSAEPESCKNNNTSVPLKLERTESSASISIDESPSDTKPTNPMATSSSAVVIVTTPSVSATPSASTATPVITTTSSNPLETPGASSALITPSTSASGTETIKAVEEDNGEKLLNSSGSFKVLTECPLIVMLLFQLYPKYIESNIPALIPLMMKALTLKAPEKAEKTHRSRYAEFLACQVKTLSFLTYLLRGFSNVMRTFEESIGSSVIQLLVSCPPEAVTTRKELLVATRHILATDFRNGFFAHVDTLSDERVLIGQGRACYQALRPLAYSTLADLIHHVRTKLTLQQLSKIIYLFSRNMHDATLPTSIQTTSVRLLLNLMDYIFHNKDSDHRFGRMLLVRILESLVSKFGTLKASIPRVIQSDHLKRSQKTEEFDNRALAKLRQSELLLMPEVNDKDISSAENKKPSVGINNQISDSVNDIKSLIRTLILGLKTVIWCVTNYNSREDDNQSKTGLSAEQQAALMNKITMTEEERKMVARFLKNGLKCFMIYGEVSKMSLAGEKEVLDHFAGAFTVLEASNFRDVFIVHMELLYECILKDQAILTIPQHFLANSNASASFAEIMLNFLTLRLDDLTISDGIENPDTLKLAEEKASIILRLFKIVFGSVTLFAANEPVLQPHLLSIVTKCLQKTMMAKNNSNYYYLLRALFRSISGRKFEMFYKEFLPLLPGLLSGLIRAQQHATDPVMRNVLLELCLTIPARLSSLLQYLPLMMHPLLATLESKGELINLGLRTLEFWVDNLNPEFLFPIFSGQNGLLVNLTNALCSHLQPPPYPYGMLAMRLLGKLGGRNRRFLKEPHSIPLNQYPNPGVSINVPWKELEGKSLSIPLDMCIHNVCDIFDDLYVSSGGSSSKSSSSMNVSKISKRAGKHQSSILQALNISSNDGDIFNVHESPIETESSKSVKDKVKQAAQFTVKHSKSQAFQFISKMLASMMQIQSVPDLHKIEMVPGENNEGIMLDESTTVKIANIVNDLESSNCEKGIFPDEVRKYSEHQSSKKGFTRLILTTLRATGDQETSKMACELMSGLLRHFCLTILSHSVRYEPDSKNLDALTSEPSSIQNSRGLSPVKDVQFDDRAKAFAQSTFGSTALKSSCTERNLFVVNEALIEALSGTNTELIALAKQSISELSEITSVICTSPEKAVKFGGVMYGNLAEICISYCYEKDWLKNIGGCRGIRILTEILHENWILEHELRIVRAILFVFANHEPEVTVVVMEEASATLDLILTKCHKNTSKLVNETSEVAEEENKETVQPKQFTGVEKELIKLFTLESLNAKEPVRKATRKAIEYIASVFQLNITSLLQPHQELMNSRLFAAPLRQLPKDLQIGLMDAVCYGFELSPPLFTLTKDVLIFLQEVWFLTTGEDPTSQCISNGAGLSNILGSISSGQLYPCELSHAVRLRVHAIKCIRSVFMTSADQLNEHADVRNKFVSLFFRSLTGQPDEVVCASESALADIIEINNQSKDKVYPKELLQACLRPVLLNLADYRKLTLPLLEGLSRLLHLLSNCFNLTLGDKVLDHLKEWENPNKIVNSKIWTPGEEPKVAAAIITLFHLLPPSDKFLQPLVRCVIRLEKVLPRYGNEGRMSSPYRRPLTLFLNRYASQAVTFFLQREYLMNAEYSSLFQCILKRPEAGPIRAILTADGGAEAIMTATFVAASKLAESTSSSNNHHHHHQSVPASSNMQQQQGPPSQTSSSLEMNQIQAQIRINAQKTHAQTLAAAQSQGLSMAEAQMKAKLGQAAYIAKAQAQYSAQQKARQQQTEANAQKVYAQTLAASQTQGLGPVGAKAKAQAASDEYTAKMKLVTAPLSSSAMATPQTSYPLPTTTPVTVAGGAVATAPEAPPSPSLNMNSQQVHLDALELHFQGLRIVRILAKLDPDWLCRQKIIVDCLRKLWRSSSRLQRLIAEEKMILRHQLESKLLVKCLIVYCKVKPEDVQVLFDLLTIFLRRSLIDFSFLKSFYREVVAKTYLPIYKRAILKLFLRMLQEQNASEDIKVQALQLLILPMLAATFEDPAVDNLEIVDQEIISCLIREVLSESLPSDFTESLRIELLQLATLLIEHMGDALLDHRKHLIKFAWNHLKSEDSMSQQWAYVNVCRFIAVYDTPPKIILQVYVALLRTYDPDARDLVRHALDILTPALPKRLKAPDFIKAIKWTKKIIYEEGHAIQQLVHIWQLLVRQPALFYGYRAQFVPQMVNSLNRLALPPNSPLESRSLAVALVDLIISWDQIRRERIEEKKQGLSSSSTTSSTKEEEEKSKQDIAASKKRDASQITKESTPLTTTEELSTASKDEDNKRLKNEQGEGVSVSIAEGSHATGSTTSSSTTEATAARKSPLHTAGPTTASSSSEDDFELNPTMVEMIDHFLVRFALVTAEGKETEKLSKRCTDLFSISLSLWPGATVRFTYLEKLLIAATSASQGGATISAADLSDPTVRKIPLDKNAIALPVLKAVLRILNTMTTSSVIDIQKVHPFALTHLSKIQQLIDPCFDIHDIDLQHLFNAFILRMVKLYPPSEDTPTSSVPGISLSSSSPVPSSTILYTWIRHAICRRCVNATVIEENVDRSASVDGKSNVQNWSGQDASNSHEGDGSDLAPMAAAARMRCSAHPAMETLDNLSTLYPKFMENFVPSLLKLAHSLTRDHLQAVELAERTREPSLNGSTGGVPVGVNPGPHAKDFVMATPSLALMNHYMKDRPNHKNEMNTKLSPSPTYNTTNRPVVSSKLSITNRTGDVVETLLICMRVLSKCDIASIENRRIFITLLSQCIEKSTHIPLLIGVTRIVSPWVSHIEEEKPPVPEALATASSSSSAPNEVAASVSTLPAVTTSGSTRDIAPTTTTTSGTPTSTLSGPIPIPPALAKPSSSNNLMNLPPVSSEQPAPVEPSTGFLTLQDKISLLSKMAFFERLDEVEAQPLFAVHRELLLKLSLQNSKGFAKGIFGGSNSAHLTGPFMVALMSPDLDTRKKFFKLVLEQKKDDGNENSSCLEKTPGRRLEFIFNQDWQGCGTRLWIVTATEILLQALMTTDTVCFSDGPTFCPTYPLSSLESSNGRSHDETTTHTQAYEDLISSQEKFYRDIVNVQTSELISPLCDLMHIDMDLAQFMWTRSFASAWSQVSDDAERHIIVDRLGSILSKRYHRRRLMTTVFCSEPRNVVRVILEGLTLCYPIMPNISSELLLFLANTYNAWYYVLPICEYQVLQAEHSCSSEERERWVTVLSSLYQSLDEVDLDIGLSHRFCSQTETRLALALEGHGLVKEAQDMYFKAMCKAHSNRLPTPQMTKFEMKVWETRWVSCARHMNQWQLLHDFGRSVHNQELMLESAWKRGDWQFAKQMLSAPSVQAALEAGCPDTRLIKLYVALQPTTSGSSGSGSSSSTTTTTSKSNHHNEIELLMTQIMHLTLHKWQSVSSSSHGSSLAQVHVPFFHLFHQFAEAQESAQMISDIHQCSSSSSSHPQRHRQVPDFKSILSSWRERLPNVWESLLRWDDILTWRSHVFHIITSTFTYTEPQQLACLHDGPWSAITLAHVARKQELGEVCLSALAKLYSVSTMDVQDAFSKLREQVLMCHDLPNEHRGGLSIINNTNLDYFNPQQKSELFRLKASFLSAMGGKNEANQAFSHALQICPSYAKGWLSWGKYCDALYDDQKQVEFAVQALACYLQAVHHRSVKGRLMLARVLWLLSKDDDRGNLAHAFEAHGKQLPIWIWIIWIPQLLTSLSRPEAPQVRGLLRGVAAKFPQALYHTMRAFLLEKREIPLESMVAATDASRANNPNPNPKPTNEDPANTPTNTNPTEELVYVRTKTGHVVSLSASLPQAQVKVIPGLVGPSRTSAQSFGQNKIVTLAQWQQMVAEGGEAMLNHSTSSSTTKITSVQYIEDLMGFLRRTHQSLALELEAMLEEVIIRFRPLPEEELLSAVHALLLKCYQLPQADCCQPVPSSLRTTLERVSKKFFSTSSSSSSSSSSKANQHLKFIMTHKEAFHRDFLPPETLGTTSTTESNLRQNLYQVVAKLKQWRHALASRVKRKHAHFQLESCSRYLTDFHSLVLEIPGQYMSNDSEPNTDLHVKLRCFESRVDVLHRNGFSQRRLRLRGSNGHLSCFLVQFAIPHITRTDERMMQLHLLLNQMLSAGVETRKRHLHYRVPTVIPITPRVRLMADDVDYTSLGDIYEHRCMELGQDVDAPITHYRDQMREQYERQASATVSSSSSSSSAAAAAAAAPHQTTDSSSSSSVSSTERTQEQRVLAQDLMVRFKKQLHHDICSDVVPEHIVSQYMMKTFSSWDQYYRFRSVFTQQLALHSFLCYIFALPDRSPHKMMFSQSSGEFLSLECRPGYNVSTGLVEAVEAVPFRLTRNLQTFLTHFSIEGSFAHVMTTAAQCLVNHVELVENQLNLFFRDDLMSWHASKSSPHSEEAQRRLELQFQDRVSKNVARVLDKVNSIAPKPKSAQKTTFQSQKIYELLEVAMDSNNIMQMNPTWYPWL